jgi:UDP-glucose 4-epimerase
VRVLVTGSHGFIGSQLVLALKERGDEVVEWDTKNGRDCLTAAMIPFDHLDEIYHLACINQEAALDEEWENMGVNALGAKIMAQYARQHGARFVYTSTASVYGDATMIPTPVFSNSALMYAPLNPKSDYAVAKLAGEHFVKNSGADYTVFRLSNVYGPGQTTENPYCGVVAKFFEGAMAGETLKTIGDGSQTRDFTYVEDILPHLMNPELKGVLNCSHGKEIEIRLLREAIFEIVGSSKRWEFVPERPVDGIQRRCLISDVTCPTDLQTGLRRTYDWLLAQNADFSHNSVGEAKSQV